MHARQSLFRHEKTSTDDGPARHPGRPIRDPIWSPREREGARELTNPPAGTVAITATSLELELDAWTTQRRPEARSDPIRLAEGSSRGARARRDPARARAPDGSFLGNWLPRSADFPCTARSGTPKGRKAGTAGATTDARPRPDCVPPCRAERDHAARGGRAGQGSATGTPPARRALFKGHGTAASPRPGLKKAAKQKE